MKEDTLKFPFFISIIFHSLVLLSIAFLYQPAKNVMFDITPVEVLQIAKQETPLPVQASLKQEPKKIVKALPAVPRQEEKNDEIKNEPEKINVPVALPQPVIPETGTPEEKDISAAVPVDASNVSAGSKYDLEGGVGKANEDEMKLFSAMVRSKIERAKFYPRWARERGYEGIVGVQFVIKPDGTIVGLKVVRPCHCDILNKAACEAIMKAAPFSPRPRDIENKEMAMEVDVGFRLE